MTQLKPRRPMGHMLLAGMIAALLAILPLAPTSGRAQAASLRSRLQQADEDANQGRLDQAVPIWVEAAFFYEAAAVQSRSKSEATGDWTNSALYWKMAGQAYDKLADRDWAVDAYTREARTWRLAGEPSWGDEDMLRAATLRSSVRIFVERQGRPIYSARIATDASTGTTGGADASKPALYEPQSGAYLGVYSEIDPPIGNTWAQSEKVYGKAHAIGLIYNEWRQMSRVYLAQGSPRTAVEIAWQFTYGLDSVVDDDYLHAFAKQLRDAKVPVFLRVAGEMNGDWVPWSGNPELYKQKFRLVAQVMHREAPNVAIVWSPNPVPQYNILDYYPGDDVVDWVGVSVYLNYYENNDPGRPQDHADPLARLDFVYDHFADRKPIMITEGAIAHAEYATGTDRTAWGVANLRRLYGYLPLVYPRVKAVVWFSVDQKSSLYGLGNKWADYQLTDNPEVLKAYKDVTSSAYYHSRVPDPGEVTPIAPSSYVEIGRGEALKAGVEHLSAFVKGWDTLPSKVEYLVNGVSIGAATALPYSLEYDFSGLAGKLISLGVRVYDSQGQMELSVTKQVPVGTLSGTFPDTVSHWARDDIAELVGMGVVSGLPDGDFHPDEAISRAAFTKLLISAVNMETPPPFGSGYSDVLIDDWAAPYVSAAVRDGILEPGESGSRLNPAGPATMGEVARMLVRAMGLDQAAQALGKGAPTSFADDAAIPAALKPYVQVAANNGLIKGRPDNTFGAAEPVTRAQAAVIIQRLLDLQTAPASGR